MDLSVSGGLDSSPKR